MYLYVIGSIKFIKSDIGKEFTMEDNVTFKVFRHVIIKSSHKNITDPQAIFKIRFQPKDMTVEENKKFSKIPMLVFMGFHGFRSKYWMVNEETGLCQGIYEWNTLQDAVAYSKSIAVKFMSNRSIQGSVKYEIIKISPQEQVPVLSEVNASVPASRKSSFFNNP
jgi:hypothetical protein